MREYFMREALKEAEIAYKLAEVPIGAVIVKDGVIIARGHNQKECLKDPTLHAEIIAIKQASKHLKSWRLTDCEMYVTIEPCVMCAGALYQSRISKVFIGSKDTKAGAVESLYNIFSDNRLNHNIEYEFGILEHECSSIIKNFFSELRTKK